MKQIPVAGPWITEKEIDYVTQAARHGWYDRAGEFQEKFEQAFAKRVGTHFAISLPHCTSAIHLALVALGIGKADEVIVPDVTWIASAAPLQYVGATPVFADMDATTWCLSADSVERLITPETKAILAVDLYGGMPDYDRLRLLADDRKLPLIEDAGQAVGARYFGEAAGSLGRVGVFSFHGSKTLSTGEGGMLVTNDEKIYNDVLFLRDHGRPPGDKLFLNSKVAFKYRMSAVQAALGLAQTERLDELVAKKRELFSWYTSLLGGIRGLTFNQEPEGVENSYWMSTVILDPGFGIDKVRLMHRLNEKGIRSRPFFWPLSSQKAYAGTPSAATAARQNRVSYAISPYGINLPSALNLTREDVEYVCEALKEILGVGLSCPTKTAVQLITRR